MSCKNQFIAMNISSYSKSLDTREISLLPQRVYHEILSKLLLKTKVHFMTTKFSFKTCKVLLPNFDTETIYFTCLNSFRFLFMKILILCDIVKVYWALLGLWLSQCHCLNVIISTHMLDNCKSVDTNNLKSKNKISISRMFLIRKNMAQDVSFIFITIHTSRIVAFHEILYFRLC